MPPGARGGEGESCESREGETLGSGEKQEREAMEPHAAKQEPPTESWEESAMLLSRRQPPGCVWLEPEQRLRWGRWESSVQFTTVKINVV